MKKMLAVVLSLFLFAGAPAPAGADCCDDILSCAAAIATDGLTCVVIETINVVTHLIGVVKNVKDNLLGDVESAGRGAQQQVTDTINTFQSQVQMSKDQFATSEQLAANLYNQEANGRMVALKNPSNGGVGATTASPSLLSNSSSPSTVVAPANSAVVPRTSAAAPSNTAPSTTTASPSRTSGRAISPNAVRSTPSQPIPAPVPATPNSTLADTQKLNTAVSRQNMNAAQQPRPLAGAYSDTFSRGVAEIKRLRMAGERDAVRVYSSMQVASTTSNQEKAARAVDLAQKAITAPLSALGDQLSAMLRDPSKIFDPSAAVNSEIDHVFSTVDTSIQQMVDSITADAQKQFDAAQPAYTELQMDATRAARIAAAMDALHRDRSTEALDALNGLLPKSAASTINERGATAMLTSNQMSHIQVMSKFTAGKLKAGPSRIKVQEISTGFAQLKTLQSRALTIRASMPNLKSNLSQKMNSYFTGRTAAEIASQKEQLIFQARSRFANDPRTREAVINLLNSEAAKRQVMQRH